MRRNADQPLFDLAGQRTDVGCAYLVEAGAHRSLRRGEEPRVNRVRIGAADQLQRDHVVGGNHPGVAGLELGFQSFRFQPVVDGVDARRDDQHRSRLALGEEVAQGPVQRTCQLHGLAGARDQSKRTCDAAHFFRRSVQYYLARLLYREAIELVRLWFREIDYLLNVLLLHRALDSLSLVKDSAVDDDPNWSGLVFERRIPVENHLDISKLANAALRIVAADHALTPHVSVIPVDVEIGFGVPV